MPKKMNMEAAELRKYILENAGSKTAYEMHMETYVDAGTIRKYAAEMGVMLETKEQRNKRIDDAILQHHESKTCREIAALVGVTMATIYSHGYALGVDFKPGGVEVKQAVARVRERFFRVRRGYDYLTGAY